MTQKLLTIPFRLGLGAARTAFDVSAKTINISTTLVETAIGLVRSPDDGQDTDRRDTEPTPTPGPTTQTRTQTRPPAQTRVNGQPANGAVAQPGPPPPAAPVTPPQEQPDTPLTPQQDAVKTVADEDEEEVIAEFAEPGAEEGAGAQLDVEEPWEGYAAMNASTVIARIEQADPAQLAVLELYEQTHKKRQTVLSAAAKRLRASSPPEPESE